MPLQVQTALVNHGTSRFVKAAETNSVTPGNGVAVKLEGNFIGIHNVDGEYYAIDNICPHVGGVLHAGKQKDGILVCPIHEWKFDVKTGKCIWPGECELATYPLKVRGGDILVNLDSPSLPPKRSRLRACSTNTVERPKSSEWRIQS
jgi:nitrite reductase (NADH) small subunit/3-phenylpropionate/trans-cinnamate dioxygenase ferredoxin subunit